MCGTQEKTGPRGLGGVLGEEFLRNQGKWRWRGKLCTGIKRMSKIKQRNMAKSTSTGGKMEGYLFKGGGKQKTKPWDA